MEVCGQLYTLAELNPGCLLDKRLGGTHDFYTQFLQKKNIRRRLVGLEPQSVVT
jgi:hypothetical protein